MKGEQPGSGKSSSEEVTRRRENWEMTIKHESEEWEESIWGRELEARDKR